MNSTTISKRRNKVIKLYIYRNKHIYIYQNNNNNELQEQNFKSNYCYKFFYKNI